jgi:surface protein
MTEMFSGATEFNGDLNRWDVSNVTKMHVMFYQVTQFNRDIGQWDVSQVTNSCELQKIL